MTNENVYRILIWITGILVAIFLPPFAKYQELQVQEQKAGRADGGLKEENERLEEEKSGSRPI